MRYNPKSNFVFGSVNLADYNGAFAFYCNVFDKPERDVEVVSVPGRNGDLLFDNGRYKNVNRTYIVQVEGIDAAHRLMYDLLSNVGYQKLMDDYDTAYYYMARIRKAPQIIGFVGDAVKMEITFDRMPQRWLSDTTEEEIVNASPDTSYTCGARYEVYNRTNNVALPKLKIQLYRNQYIVSDMDIQITVDPIGSDTDDGVYGRVFLHDIWANSTFVVDNEKKAIYYTDTLYNPDTLQNLSKNIYSDPFRWMTIPTIQEGVAVKISISRTYSYSFYAKIALDMGMWEL